MLEINIKTRFEDFKLDIGLSLDNAINVICGSSGSGKTLLLKHIAGFMKPETGSISYNTVTLSDSSSNIFLAPEKRKVAFVLQEAFLFKHMDVKQNLLFGSKLFNKDYFNSVVEVLHINDLLKRNPNSLSVGEKQRVSIGRALLSSPELILMDEPLASLHEDIKWEILDFIRRLHDELNIPIIYVTHSRDESDYIADTISILEKGTVRASASKEHIFNSEIYFKAFTTSSYNNLFEAEIISEDLSQTTLEAKVRNIVFKAVNNGRVAKRNVHISIPADSIMLTRTRPETVSARNIHKGKVRNLINTGRSLLVILDSGSDIFAEITISAGKEMDLKQDDEIFFFVKAAAIRIFS